jgi:hypothetical protein
MEEKIWSIQGDTDPEPILYQQMLVFLGCFSAFCILANTYKVMDG